MSTCIILEVRVSHKSYNNNFGYILAQTFLYKHSKFYKIYFYKTNGANTCRIHQQIFVDLF